MWPRARGEAVQARTIAVEATALGDPDAAIWSGADGASVELAPTPRALQPAAYLAQTERDRPVGRVKQVRVNPLPRWPAPQLAKEHLWPQFELIVPWEEAVSKGAVRIQDVGPFRVHTKICRYYEPGDTVYPGQCFVEKKMCWPTLTGRQRWSIHSTFAQEPHMLQLQRGERLEEQSGAGTVGLEVAPHAPVRPAPLPVPLRGAPPHAARDHRGGGARMTRPVMVSGRH